MGKQLQTASLIIDKLPDGSSMLAPSTAPQAPPSPLITGGALRSTVEGEGQGMAKHHFTHLKSGCDLELSGNS